ncbi:glycosyl hydrolase family 18 protein [Effusibacillus pohliae]|uniref:glycosyl hydrolase family 18 protein n=1 Tax=Effusibacillus pohliae TaxID=232270 RepID=UPI00036D302F|nr:LysM peptidoglycan-binding domain-containing protein [Effusibacillus pohliae]
MFVHVVKSGETLFSIANRYGGTAERIRAANDLQGDQLIPGMSLLIPAGPRSTLEPYKIREGDTLDTISGQLGVPPHIIQAVNERLDEQNLVAGETIWLPVPLRAEKTIDVNAFMIPTGGGIDQEILLDAADCLTYLSVFHRSVNPDGTLSDIPDDKLIDWVKAEHVAPLLTVTNFEGDRFSPDLAHVILQDANIRRQTIENIVNLAKTKGYQGVNIDFEHLHPEERDSFNCFVRELAEASASEGLPITVTLGPKTADDPNNPWMGAFDYRTLGGLADRVILMTFEWGWVGGPPMAVAPLNMVRRVLDYATTVIPSDKILMGIALYGYNWPTPYEEGNRATGISPKAAVEQAIRAKGHIHFHAESAAPMFMYRGPRNEMRQVWFEDARSVLAKFHLVRELELGGISYWMLGNPFPQNWTLLHSTFQIRKPD